MKLTIDLKEKLQQINIRNKKQELIVAEAKNILDKNYDEDILLLKSVGLCENIESAREILDIENYKQQLSDTFGVENVFTLEQIEKTCIKYRLKFLNSKKYKGVLDPILPTKIKEFQNNIKNIDVLDNNAYFIMAPVESFNLEIKPKDPLFFYKTKYGFFILIHKWGKDLSIFRSVFNWHKRSEKTLTIFNTIIALLVLNILIYQGGLNYLINTKGYDDTVGMFVICNLIITFIVPVLSIYNTSGTWFSKYNFNRV